MLSVAQWLSRWASQRKGRRPNTLCVAVLSSQHRIVYCPNNLVSSNQHRIVYCLYRRPNSWLGRKRKRVPCFRPVCWDIFPSVFRRRPNSWLGRKRARCEQRGEHEINVTSSSIRFDEKMIPVPHFGSGAVVWVGWGQRVRMGRRRWGWWSSDVVDMCRIRKVLFLFASSLLRR